MYLKKIKTHLINSQKWKPSWYSMMKCFYSDVPFCLMIDLRQCSVMCLFVVYVLIVAVSVLQQRYVEIEIACVVFIYMSFIISSKQK